MSNLLDYLYALNARMWFAYQKQRYILCNLTTLPCSQSLIPHSDKMVNPGCYTGLRLQFMHKRLIDYNTKKSDVDREAFILQSIRMFLKRFPVSLGEDEPSEEHLSSVDDSVVEVEEPLPEEGTEEYDRVWQERLVRADKEKKRGEVSDHGVV